MGPYVQYKQYYQSPVVSCHLTIPAGLTQCVILYYVLFPLVSPGSMIHNDHNTQIDCP